MTSDRHPTNVIGIPHYDNDTLLRLERAVLDLLRAVVSLRPVDAVRMTDQGEPPVPLVVVDLTQRRVLVRSRRDDVPPLEVISLVGAPGVDYGQSTRWAHEALPGGARPC